MPEERKLVTVIFADIAGFTSLAETMDPEHVRDLINACFDQLVPAITQHGGVVDKFIGDAIMALMRNDLDVLGLSWPTMSKGVRDSKGKISSLFVASKSRLSALKDVPTLGELGVQLTSTSASVLATTRLVAGPKGLDKSVRESLESAVAKTMKDPEFLQRMEKAQQMVGYANSATVQANIASALEAYTSVKALVEPFLKK